MSGDDGEAERRARLRGLLGELPVAAGPVAARDLGREECGSYVLEHLMLDAGGPEGLPAVFTRPRAARGRGPAVLFCHSHAPAGKDEMLRGGAHMPAGPWAEALAREGVAALCWDAWNFGERSGRTESELFKEMLWEGRVLWGMMVWDALRGFDYLAARDDVDPDRIAAVGMSMGSTTAWWVAALEPRVRACVDICCLTDFRTLVARRGLDGHGIYYFVPGLLRQFETADINALIAPRPHLALAGRLDPLTPPEGLERVDRRLREVYAARGAPEAWRLSCHDVGHVETRAMRAEALEFLRRWL